MNPVPDCNNKYKESRYWDERYTTEETFEWFGDFSKFRHLVVRNIKQDDHILMLGK